MSLASLSDAALAAHLAEAAGRLALEVRAGSGLTGKACGDAGDAAANRLLCDAIRAARPMMGCCPKKRRTTLPD